MAFLNRDFRIFIKPFFDKRKLGFTFIFFVVLLFILPFLLIYFIEGLNLEGLRDNFFSFRKGTIDHKFFLAIWISIVATYVSLRIYYEIRNKANNLEEFLHLVSDIVNDAADEDEMYIILPTPFIGYLQYLKGKSALFKRYESKLLRFKNLKIAFLHVELDKLPPLKGPNLKDNNTLSKVTAVMANPDEKDELLKFHNRELLSTDESVDIRIQYFCNLITFLNKLKERTNQTAKENGVNVKIDSIDFKHSEDEFYVLVVNKNKNLFFNGTVKIYSQVDIRYTGEKTESESLTRNINTVYAGYIKN